MTDLEEIKKRLDIVTLVSEYVPLKKTGANFKGLCPFHTEKTPSFVVSPERQIWHCFGGCQDGGDIFRFLMRVENIEFPEAIKILAKRTSVPISQSYGASQKAETKEKIFAMNHLASEFYHYILTTHPAGKIGREYIDGRKISESSVKLFKIGYAPNSWDNLTKFLKKKGYTEADLIEAGLAGKSSIGNTFDRFRNRVMFTLFDHQGNVVGFAGRLLDPNAKEAKYINTSETPAYVKGNVLYGLNTTKDEIKKAGFAVVVEGEIDAISSYQAGVRNIVAIKGSALTEGQVGLLKRYTEQVYLSLDSDFAGDAAAHRGIEIADKAGLTIKVVTFPPPPTGAKDPDELIKKDPTLWHKAVKDAVNFYDYIIDSAIQKYDVNSAEGGRKIVSEVAKFIAPIENLIVKNHYLRLLAKKLSVSETDLDTQINRETKKTSYFPSQKKETVTMDTKVQPPRIELLQEYLLSLLLQSPRPSDYLLLIAPRLSPLDFSNQVLGKIYQLLLSFCENPKSDVSLPEKFDIKNFAQIVPEEILPTMDRIYLTDITISTDDDAKMLEEVQKTVWEIKELSLKERQKNLSGEIKKNPEDEDLLKDFDDTTKQLQKLLEEKTLIGH